MRNLVKWAATALGVAFVLLLVLAGSLYFLGSSKVDRAYQAQLATLVVPEDSATIVRGEHLSKIYGCTDCHGADLSGQTLVDDPPFRVTASNLTSGEGGIGSTFTHEDLDRAIRHGIRPNGRPLLIMPSSVYNNMADDDVAAIISYLRTVAPVDTQHPPTEVRALGKVMAAALINPSAEVRTSPARSGAAPAVAPTAEYGEYLTSIFCTHCHGGDLRGNPSPPDPASPPAPDLAASGRWSFDLFVETLRTGVSPSGHQMDPKIMPWTATAHMTDVELEALHTYLSTLGD